jgi:hypothetical protein
MKTFKLTKQTFIEYTTEHEDLSYVLVEDLGTLEKYINPMKTLIDYFNTEYKWDGMFNIDEVQNRIIFGLTLFILYYDKQPIGYVWFKKLDNTTCLGYNLYVTKQMDRPTNAPKWFYNKATLTMLEKYDTIKVEIFEWNIAAIKLVYSFGSKCITLL